MNKSLLFIFSLFLSVSLSAQTLTIDATSYTVAPGGNLVITTTYTTASGSTDPHVIYVGVELRESNGSTWVDTTAESTTSVTNGTNMEQVITLSIPTDATQTSSLTNGRLYKAKVELNNSADSDNWAWQAGQYPDIVIDAAASVADAETLTATMYPNPTKGVLHLAAKASLSSYKVINLTGKVVEERSHAGLQSIDVSHLNRGIYFLQVDAYKAVKFVKQ